MEKIPKGWPKKWAGESLVEVEDGRKIRCKILLTKGYAPSHLENYAGIMERWGDLWPAARTVIETMLAAYGRDTRIDESGNYLQIDIPRKLIGEGAAWCIALQKNGGRDGAWEARFRGWKVSAKASQPYF
jgi:hypothetical protein